MDPSVTFGVFNQYYTAANTDSLLFRLGTSLAVASNASLAASSLLLTNVQLLNNNSNSMTKLAIDIDITGRSIWIGEQIVLDMTDFGSSSIDQIRCVVLQNNSISHIWQSIDLSVISSVALLANNYIFQQTNFTVRCKNLINKNTTSQSISAHYTDAVTNTQISGLTSSVIIVRNLPPRPPSRRTALTDKRIPPHKASPSPGPDLYNVRPLIPLRRDSTAR